MNSQIDIEYEIDRFRLRVHHQWNGPVLGVIGHSGAGKSTFLEILAGLKTASGEATVADHTLFNTHANLVVPISSRGVGWVPQEALLFPHLTCQQNIRFAARGNDVETLIRDFELTGVRDKYPRQISGGEKMRTALARAIAARPKLLLLDEPLASLDTPMKKRIFPYFKWLRDEAKIPMIYVSHDLEDVKALTRNIIEFEQGTASPLNEY